MQPMNHRSREAGFTLLELLLVVGVGALLLIGGIATYRLVSEGNKAAETMRQVMMIRNEAQNVAQGQGYTGIDTALTNANVLTATPRNAFGGALTVTGDADTLTIGIEEIPPGACNKLAMGIREQGAQLNGAAIPENIGDVTMCGADENTLTWTFP